MTTVTAKFFADSAKLFQRHILPQTLFARTMLAILVPVFVLQTSVLLIFFGRPWSDFSEQLVRSVVREIDYVVQTLPTLREDQREDFMESVGTAFDIRFRFAPSKEALIGDPPPSFIAKAVKQEMSKKFGDKGYQAYFYRETASASFVIPTPEGLLVATAPLKRLFSSSINSFALAFVVITLLLFTMSMIAIRNQIKPIRRLASLANSYGKGLPTPDIYLGGATEVRQAAHAFRTMRRRIDQQIRQRTVMLAGVSHDLRTPLTRMKLELALIQDKQSLEMRATEDLTNDILNMEEMITGYLEFARGQANIAPEWVNLIELVEEITLSMASDKVALTFHPPKGSKRILTRALIRKLSLRRSIENLIGNAIKYGNGTCDVWLSVQGKDMIEICVEDNGSGIAEDRREEALQPFTRLEPHKIPETGSVGLGLTTTRDALVSLGGELVLETASSGGLRARAVFPA